jgi:hypothetical protein
MKKWFWGIVVAVFVAGVIFWVASVGNDGSDDKAEWSDQTFSAETDGRQEADSETEGNGKNADNKKNAQPSSDSRSPFKDNRVIVDYDYGACNNGCGCTQYAHYSGRKACVNCAKNDCPTSKYDHERRN